MLNPFSLKERARELGFDLCGIARTDAYPQLRVLPDWIARGYAGEMHYLERTAEKRADLRHVLPSSRSIIVLGTNYHTDRPYSTEVSDPAEALIARYAWGDDYHEVIGRRLEALIAWMREQPGEPFEARAYVDTGPVQERVYAQQAGLGWIGKNCCLINPQIGSWVFLSEILCSLDLDPDAPALDQCGTCTLCLEACPTEAFVAPGMMDATRCLSYLTIEAKSAIPDTLASAVGSHIYGCDVCQETCPWNQSPPVSTDPAWQPRAAFDRPKVKDIVAMSDDDLRLALTGSAMTRTKISGLRRNLAVVLDNIAAGQGQS